MDEVFQNFSRRINSNGQTFADPGYFGEPEMKHSNQPGLPFNNSNNNSKDFLKAALENMKSLNPDLNINLSSDGGITVNQIEIDDF